MHRRGRLALPDGGAVKADLAAIQAALAPAHPSLVRQGRRVAALAGGDAAVVQSLCDVARAGEQVAGLWRLRPASLSLVRAGIQVRLPHLALAVLALAVLVQGCEVGFWALLGAATLAGQAPAAPWLLALLLAPAALSFGQGLLAESLARRLAVLVRQRLLTGALALSGEALKMDGPEGLLARGLEAQGFEAAVTAAVLNTPLALAGVVWAAWALWQGAGGLAVLFLALLALQPLLIGRHMVAARAWAESRRGLSARLIGWMIGHRSLPLIGAPEAIQATEAGNLSDYARRSARMDRLSLVAFALMPNGWTLAALTILAGLGLG